MLLDAQDSNLYEDDSEKRTKPLDAIHQFLGLEVTDDELVDYGRSLDRFFSILEEWSREDEL